MSGEADDLMLNLMQIADEVPAPEPAATAPNPLAALKPYPHHKGECLGAVAVQPGVDEDSGQMLLRFVCAKCGKEEIVPMQVHDENGAHVGAAKAPDWVASPNV